MRTLLFSTLIFAFTANSAIIYKSSGLDGLFQTENFDINGGLFTPAGTQFSGITFSPEIVINDNYGRPNMSNNVLSNFPPKPPQDPTWFEFDSDLTELAFAFFSQENQTTIFEAYLNNALVESAPLITGFSGNYVNVTGILFDKILITSPGTLNPYYLMDDMQFKKIQTVPEPSVFVLLAFGLVGLGFLKRKQ